MEPISREKSPEPEQKPIENRSCKKLFFKSLVLEKHAEKPKQLLLQDDREQDVKEVVQDVKEEPKVIFSLRSLLDFKHVMREQGDLQMPDPKKNGRCRKRPNYNNSKRAFFATGRPPSTQELLACC